MARINYPLDFLSQQELCRSIKTKHDADGGNSALIAYLLEQRIDFDGINAQRATALTHHNNAGLLSRQAEYQVQLRNSRFDPVYDRFKKEVQFLKSFYKNNPKALGEWGITVDGQSRIAYPSSFEDKAALFNTFTDKHISLVLAGGSPLQPYLNRHGIDPAGDQIVVGQAVANNKGFLAAGREAEAETASRNKLHAPLVAAIHSIGDFLKKLYSDNAKSLGAWGFTVDDSPRAPKLRTTSLKPGESVIGNSVSIGGTFTNIGTGDLHLYRGKTTTGTPYIIHPGEQMGMIKGFSTIRVVNPSTLIAGKFTVLTSNA